MTSNIMFFYDNLLLSATLSASSAASGLPASNLKDPLRGVAYRTAGTPTPGTANLVIDHIVAKGVKAVILGGYNWLSAPGTLDFEFNDTDSWGSPAKTEALTWNANPTANGNFGMIIKVFSEQSYRYNRLNVVYSPGGTPTDWDLGLMGIYSSYFQPDRDFRVGWGMDIVDESYVDRSVGGQRHADEISKYRTFDFDFKIPTQAQWELFQKMFNTVGITKDLFIAFDYDNEPDEMTIYGAFTKLPGAKSPRVGRFTAAMSFEESR